VAIGSAEFSQLASRIVEAFPEVYADVYGYDDAPGGYCIALLSSGPDHAPEIQKVVPPGWSFSGWKNPDQRNNMAVVKKRIAEEQE
jgi:hypothetical protein